MSTVRILLTRTHGLATEGQYLTATRAELPDGRKGWLVCLDPRRPTFLFADEAHEVDSL